MKNIYKVLIAFIGVLAVSCNADAVDERPVLNVVSTPEITAVSKPKRKPPKEAESDQKNILIF